MSDVILLLGKVDYTDNSHVVFFRNKQQPFVLFMCLDLVLERWHSFLIQSFITVHVLAIDSFDLVVLR